MYDFLMKAPFFLSKQPTHTALCQKRHPATVTPAIPQGVTSETYLEQLKSIQSECRKPKKDYNLRELMALTYPMKVNIWFQANFYF